MGKRGPKPSVTHEQKVIALSNFDIFDAADNVKKESDPVWQQVCDFINEEYVNDPAKKITKRNIQNYVTQNRNGVIFDLHLQRTNRNEKSQSSYENQIKANDSTKENVKLRIDEEKDLLQLQMNVMYKPIIKEVTSFPFSVTYWTMEAIDFASKSISKNNTFIFGWVGSFCDNFTFPDGTKSEVLNLYSFGTKINDVFISICQLLTEENSVTIFGRFFHEIVIAGAPIPNQLVVHYKYNHYVAANSVFNVNLSFEDYLTSCFLYLTENEVDMLPNCMIYTDIRLLILTVLNWDSMHSISLTSVKYFYVYCIILLSSQTSLHNFETILEKVFVIALSEFQNKTTRECFEYLMTEMKKSKIDTIYDKKNVEIIKDDFKNILDPNGLSEINYEKCPQILNYIVKIMVKAKQLVATTGMECERNAFYSESVCKSFMKCCVEFVVWTKLMHKGDDSTENLLLFDDCLKTYKNDFESYLLKDTSSMPSVVTYLMKNIEYTENQLENMKNSIQLSKQITATSQNSEYEYLFHYENWKGRNKIDSNYDSGSSSDSFESFSSDDEELDFNMDDFHDQDITSIIDYVCEESSVMEPDVSKRCDADISNKSDAQNTNMVTTHNTETNCKNNIKRGTYLRACPEIDLLHQKPTTKTIKRKLIKNYNLLKPRSVGNKKIYIVTSCFFDSIIEILVSSYHSIQKFQNSINAFSDTLTKTKQDFLNLLKEYIETFNMTKFYAARCKLCIEVCELKNDKLTWSKYIGEFLECAMYSNIFTKIQCLNCKSNSYQHCNNLSKLSLEKITSKNLSNIIHDYLQAEKNICSCPTPNIVCEYFIKDFFCIDVETEATNYSTINIKELVPSLNIANENFILTGAIAYDAPIGNNILRHYVAYIRNLTGSWMKYDNINIETSKPEKVKESTSINLALLLYIKYDTVEDNATKKNYHVVDQVDDEKISMTSNQISPEESPEFQNTVANDIEEMESFIVNEIAAQSSLVNESNIESSIINAIDVESSIVKENLHERFDESYTETCWSHNESTSSIESTNACMDKFINNLHTWRNLIQNGLKLPPTKFSTQNIKLINTCPLDSIVEVLTAAYCFKKAFNQLIFEINLSSQPDNEVFEIVKEYAKYESRNFYYEKRIEYCNSRPELYRQREKTEYTSIDCKDNVVRLFESVMGDEYSIEKSTACICNYKNTQKYKIQFVNTDFPVEDNAIQELENYLKTHFSRQTKPCYMCKKSTRLTYKIMTYFCVELETNFLLHKNIQCYLNSIPTNLHLCKENYELVGIIAFDLPLNIDNDDELLHYYSFIKLPNDEWEERNNLKDVIIRHSKHSSLKIRPALLFYVRRNVYKSDILNFF